MAAVAGRADAAGRSLQTVGTRDVTLGGATTWYRSTGNSAVPVASGDTLFAAAGADNPQSKTVPNRWVAYE